MMGEVLNQYFISLQDIAIHLGQRQWLLLRQLEAASAIKLASPFK